MKVLSAAPGDLRTPAWRRSTTWSAMTEALSRLRTELGFDDAVLLRLTENDPAEVLAADTVGGYPFQYGEPVRLSSPTPGGRWQGGPLELTSTLTGAITEMADVVGVPVKSGHLDCLLLLGNGEETPSGPQVDELARQAADLIEGARIMRARDIESGYRMVAEAAAALDDPARTWGVLLACARRLLASDTSYLAVPVTDSDFAFAQTLGVRTKGFRELRVGPGQGLGSVANEQRRVARSLNYAADPRFSAEMHQVTSDEGIYSALACPVIVADHVDALLYVANHRPLAYDHEDEAFLADFASAATLALTSSYLEEQRRQLVRRSECDRVAAILHDRLGRQLTKLSFAAAELAAQAQPENAQKIDSLSEAIQDCIATVRQEINALGSHDGQVSMSLPDLADEICSVPALSGMARTAVVVPLEAEEIVPAGLAEVLIRVGREAVFNAEVHSEGSACAVWLGRVDGDYVLEVSDDGVGLVDGSHGHGLRFAARLAEQAGGTLSVANRGDQGVRVRCVVPADGSPVRPQ